MTQTKVINEAVYVAQDKIVSNGKAEVDFLRSRLSPTLKRVRLCAHKTTDDKLQEMIITFTKDSYIRPSKHVNKEESMHVIDGIADFVFLDENGNVTDVIPLGKYGSGRQFYCRTPDSVYHTLIVRSDYLAVHETTQGPFLRPDTVFATWAPDDRNADAVRKYMQELIEKVDRFTQSQ